MPRRSRRHAAALLALVFGPPALAQLTPDRAYYGVNRPIPMTITVPDGADGEVRIDLFEPGKTEPGATAPALAGPVDLAGLFPVLWQGPSPRMRYAQLVVGGEQVGAPVVIQPMVTPPKAVLIDPATNRVWYTDPATKEENFKPNEGRLVWTTEPPAYSGVRAYADQHAVFVTSLGEIEVRLRPDAAPNSVWNFRELARGGFYTDIIVHRIVPRLPTGHPFVVQVGDPTGTGDGGPGFSFDLERSTLPHDFGILSLARSADPNTNGSQVFFALSREGTQKLDGRYTAFGEAVRGDDVLLSFEKVKVTGDRPDEPPMLKSVRLIDAPPWNKRPPALKRPASGPAKR